MENTCFKELGCRNKVLLFHSLWEDQESAEICQCGGNLRKLMKTASWARQGCWVSQREPLHHSEKWSKVISRGFLRLKFFWFVQQKPALEELESLNFKCSSGFSLSFMEAENQAFFLQNSSTVCTMLCSVPSILYKGQFALSVFPDFVLTFTPQGPVFLWTLKCFTHLDLAELNSPFFLHCLTWLCWGKQEMC